MLAAGGAFAWLQAPVWRVAALERAARAELAEEMARVERRPVLRGAALGPNGGAALAAALASLPDEGFDPLNAGDRVVNPLGEKWARLAPEAWREAAALDEARALRVLVAPTVAAVRSAIQTEGVGPVPHQTTRHRGLRIARLQAAFATDALARLTEGDATHAAQGVLDLVRTGDDLVRTGLARQWETMSFHGLVLLGPIVPRLDTTGLSRLDVELALLQASVPSYGNVARRKRLEGEVELLTRSPRDETAPRPLARYRLSGWNEWRARNWAFYALAEELAATGAEASLFDEWRRRNGAELGSNFHMRESNEVEALDDGVRAVRVARLAVVAERQRRATGHWPTSMTELLGHEPGVEDRRRRTGQPLRCRVTPEGTFQLWFPDDLVPSAEAPAGWQSCLRDRLSSEVRIGLELVPP